MTGAQFLQPETRLDATELKPSKLIDVNLTVLATALVLITTYTYEQQHVHVSTCVLAPFRRKLPQERKKQPLLIRRP